MVRLIEPRLVLLPAANETAPSSRRGPTSQVRLLTWNVQHAATPRTYRQAATLATCGEYDVLVLTEVAASESGDLLAELLCDLGYSVALPDAADDRYRVLVACRGGDMDVVSDVGVDVLPHRCLGVRVVLEHGEIGVLGLYVPSRGPKDRRNVAKRAFQRAVSAALPNLSDRLEVAGPVVIMGDLNVVEPAHRPHYPVFGQWEYDFYHSFTHAGFADAFHLFRPGRVDHSWFGRPDSSGHRNGYRFDHAFVTTTHSSAVQDCRYLQDFRTDGLSDHAAMTLTLEL